MSTTTYGVGGESGTAAAATKTITGNGNVTDLFTKLLVAQIKNQDPTSPTDPSQMVNQLTQLSQMESLQALSQQGAAQASLLSSLQMLSLGAQVGSSVQVQASQLKLDGEPVETSFTLASNSSKTQLVLTGSDGVEQRIDIGQRVVGRNSYTLDPKALGLTAGNYQVRIEDDIGQAMPLEIVATITGVRLAGNGQALVQLGSLGEYAPSAITQFNGRPATKS
jgi:flagellar basal-body rod modification protein FlgD